MCLPHLFVKHCIAGAAGCLWQGPDKSLWSLMFVSDRGWVHNRGQGDMTYIFLLSTPQTLSGLLPLPHTHSTQLKHISQSPHALLFFLLLHRVLGKWLQSPKFNIDRKHRVKCLQMPLQRELHRLSNASDYFEGNGTPTCSDPTLQHPLTQKMENSGHS